MEPLPDLMSGLKILEPFLSGYEFSFDNYKNGKGLGGQFTIATYIKENKKVIIGYRYSIGSVIYQCDNSIISHVFYMDGLSAKKLFPDFQSYNPLLSFHSVLHDFNFLVNDFFLGQCVRLKELAQLQKDEIKEHNRKAREWYTSQYDNPDIYNVRI